MTIAVPPSPPPLEIAIVLFDRLTVLDAIGPYEVLSRLPGAQVKLVAPSRGEVRTDNRALGMTADFACADVTACDLLVVPGGYGTRLLERDPAFLSWLRAIDSTTKLTASVCTGALLLGAAGLLTGRRANTHWAFRDRLAAYGAEITPERIVRDGKYASAAGVSAGIDLSLSLALELFGVEVASSIQLAIEYDPAPPLDAGDAATAPESRRAPIVARAKAREAELLAAATR
jgi:transcriptional regulator GlxA family with amidase domain